jgi:hypothetical protein
MSAGGRRGSVSTSLGRWIGVSTAFSLVVFAAAAVLVLEVVEEQEEEEELEAGAEPEEAPFEEAFGGVGMAMLVAAPLGIVLAVAAARWLAKRAVARVVAVSGTATRKTPHKHRAVS